MTMAELATALPPTHDLETLTVWVEMANQAGCSIGTEGAVGAGLSGEPARAGASGSARDRQEHIDVEIEGGNRVRFHAPTVVFDPETMVDVEWEL